MDERRFNLLERVPVRLGENIMIGALCVVLVVPVAGVAVLVGLAVF